LNLLLQSKYVTDVVIPAAKRMPSVWDKIDWSDLYAIYDTGKTRLQEGTSLGAQEETQPSDGQGSTEQGTKHGGE
jgi:hypothetical protein